MSEVLRSTKARFRGAGIDARADTLLYKGSYVQANPRHVNHLTCHSFQDSFGQWLSSSFECR